MYQSNPHFPFVCNPLQEALPCICYRPINYQFPLEYPFIYILKAYNHVEDPLVLIYDFVDQI